MSLTLIKLRQLSRLVTPSANAILHIYDPDTNKDQYILLGDLLSGTGYNNWDPETNYDTGDRVTYNFRLWESLIDTNENIIPTEGANWTEVSADVQVDLSKNTITINQTAHGLTVGKVVTGNGSGEFEAVSTPGDDVTVGMVDQVISPNQFVLLFPGSYTNTLSGLTAGVYYYVDSSGNLTSSDSGSGKVFFATSVNGGVLLAGAGGGGGGLTKPITAAYADIAALLADQAVLPQETGQWLYVIDASTDSTVGSGWAIYEYLGTTAGDLTDYLKIMEQESIDVVINDATSSVKGIAKLYTDLAASNMDGAPSQAAVKTVTDAKAPLASPAFTGTPTAPTPASGDKTTKIATTAFVGPHVPSTAVAGNDGTYDTLTCDLSTDNYWRAVITGDVKIVPTNPVDGEFFAVNLIVDAVGTQQVRVPVNSYVMSNTQDIQGGGDTYPIVIQGKASGGDPPLLTTLYFQIIEYPAATINYRIKLSERS